MQMQELQLKAQDLQRKTAKDQTDAQLKAQQQQIEMARIAAQKQQAQATIATKAMADNKSHELKASEAMSRIQTENKRIQIDMAKELLRLSKQPSRKGKD